MILNAFISATAAKYLGIGACVCPGCGQPLIPHKESSNGRRAHFEHHQNAAPCVHSDTE